MAENPMASLVGTADGLTMTDALLNLQAGGEVYFAPGVSVPGAAQSGQQVELDYPLTVSVDVSQIAAGTPVTLYFDLIAFGELDSQVLIDDVRFGGLAEPGIIISPTSGLVTSENGDTAQFTVVLATPPTSDVTVGLSSSHPDEGAPAVDELTFTPDNWNVPQSVTVMGINDDRVDGSQLYQILTSAAESDDPDYHEIDPDDVSLVNLDNDGGVLPLDLQLDPDSDSGVPGDNLTRFSRVELIGNTEPLMEILLDTEGDGFDDGSTTADENGAYRFVRVALAEGPNLLRARVGTGDELTTTAILVVLDSQPPAGELAAPEPGAVLATDVGFVDIQWTDPGPAGLDPSSFDTGDLLISGVTFDRTEDLGDGLVRYWYGEDGERLPAGLVTVEQVAGEVADLAGNTNTGDADVITFEVQQPPIEVAASMDDGDWGYRERGHWHAGPLPGGWQGDYREREADEEEGTASWVTRIEPGQYEVFVTWPADAGHAADVTYRILDGRTEVGRAKVNQQLAPDDVQYDSDAWESLGVFTISTGVPTIELSYRGTGTVVADGVLIARPSSAGSEETELGDATAIGSAYREMRPGTLQRGSEHEPADEPQVEVGAAYQTTNDRLDVDGDGRVTSADAMQVTRYLNRFATQQVSGAKTDAETAAVGRDVNGDGVVSPLDVLEIINHVNVASHVDASASGLDTAGESILWHWNHATVSTSADDSPAEANAREPATAVLSRGFAAGLLSGVIQGPHGDSLDVASAWPSAEHRVADQGHRDLSDASPDGAWVSGREWSGTAQSSGRATADNMPTAAGWRVESVLDEIVDELSETAQLSDVRERLFAEWDSSSRR